MPDPILDLLPDGVVVGDEAGRVLAVNSTAATMLQVDAHTVIGRPLAEALRLQDTEGRDWATHNQPYHDFPTRSGVPEQSWLLPDGSEVMVAARLHRVRRGGPVHRVAVSLRSGRGRARLDRERSDLVATLAHELRSPLTGVKGFVQALLNRWDKLNDEQKKLMLTTVHADSDRLSRLIVELLDVARIDTGRLQLSPRPSDAATLVRRAVDSVGAATARPFSLHVGEGSTEIWADPDKYTQVITNLLENAIRHGEGRITVSVGPDGGENGDAQVRLVVADQGEGIPPELRQRVFTKFWKGGARGGSGLGLYIVGGLTRAHGGTVEIGDAVGGGARVTVSWPRTDSRRD